MFGQLLRSPRKGSVGADDAVTTVTAVLCRTASLPAFTNYSSGDTPFSSQGFTTMETSIYLLFKSKINVVSRIVLLFRIWLRWEGSK